MTTPNEPEAAVLAALSPSRQNVVRALQRIYEARDVDAQRDLVTNTYTEDASFIDPFMWVASRRHVHLAFLSVLKTFASATFHVTHVAQDAEHNTLTLTNEQQYTLRSKAYVIQAETTLTLDAADRITRHEDVYVDGPVRGFTNVGVRKVLGSMSMGIFKLIGWK